MNKEEPYRDQAERLRQKIEKVNHPSAENFSLPPRSEVHRNKKKRTKVKLKYPLIRLLVLLFILLPITIYSIYLYKGGKIFGTIKTSISSKDYETVNYNNSTNSGENQKQANTQNSNP